MLYKDEMEIAKEIVVAQIEATPGGNDAETIAKSIETIFKKIRELAGRD